jgi:hypothetical protein
MTVNPLKTVTANDVQQTLINDDQNQIAASGTQETAAVSLPNAGGDLNMGSTGLDTGANSNVSSVFPELYEKVKTTMKSMSKTIGIAMKKENVEEEAEAEKEDEEIAAAKVCM